MIIKIDKFGEGFCRGDRWCIEESELVDNLRLVIFPSMGYNDGSSVAA